MVVVVMTRVVMVPGSGKSRAGKDHQEQDRSKDFLHGKTLARCRFPEKDHFDQSPKGNPSSNSTLFRERVVN